MTFLPIVERELRVAARKRSTFWTRAIAALAAFAFALWMLSSGSAPFRNPQTAGKPLFAALSVLAFIYALLAGIRFTADTLSEEKREGTLGLLFLTDLRGYDVVLGKLVANSLNAFYGLLAILPVLALPLLMGGVTAGEFGRMALVLCNTLFFSLTIGMAVSAVCRQEHQAMAGTLVALLVFTALTPLLAVPWLKPNQFVLPWLGYASLGHLYHLAFETSFLRAAANFWITLLVVHLLGWAFLAFASVVVLRVWQEKSVSLGSWREGWRRFNRGLGGDGRAFRTRLLDINPILWLTARDRLQPAYVWWVLALLIGGWAWGFWQHSMRFNEPIMLILALLTLNTVLKFWIASEAGRRLPADRRSGALELVLATPLTVREILLGQMLALRRQFGGPILALVLMHLIVMLVGLDEISRGEERGLWIFSLLALAAMLVADAVALSWSALSLGMSAKRPGLASLNALARVLALPWLILLALAMMGGFGRMRGFGELLLVWFLIGVVTDVVVGCAANGRLHGQFRFLATNQSPPPTPLPETESSETCAAAS